MDQQSLLKKLSMQFSEGWKLLIQPPRMDYTSDDLGPITQMISGVKYNRVDFTIANREKKRLDCSFFHSEEIHCNPIKSDQASTNGSSLDTSEFSSGFTRKIITGEDWTFSNLDDKPCVVYLHSQTGCKIEGIHLLEYCAKKHISLLLFDSAGAGRSEGEYVTLGLYEQIDLGLVLTEIKKRFNIGPVTLWGRSMGAVTAILYTEKHQEEITSLVLDSPFSDLYQLLLEIGKREYSLPSLIMGIVIKMLAGSIKSRIKADIFELKPGIAAENCRNPAYFIVGRNDNLLPKECVMDIYKKYKAKKKMIVHSNTNHSEGREDFIIHGAFEYIYDEFSKYVYSNQPKKKEINRDTKPARATVRKHAETMFFDPFMNNKETKEKPRVNRSGKCSLLNNRESSRFIDIMKDFKRETSTAMLNKKNSSFLKKVATSRKPRIFDDPTPNFFKLNTDSNAHDYQRIVRNIDPSLFPSRTNVSTRINPESSYSHRLRSNSRSSNDLSQLNPRIFSTERFDVPLEPDNASFAKFKLSSLHESNPETFILGDINQRRRNVIFNNSPKKTSIRKFESVQKIQTMSNRSSTNIVATGDLKKPADMMSFNNYFMTQKARPGVGPVLKSSECSVAERSTSFHVLTRRANHNRERSLSGSNRNPISVEFGKVQDYYFGGVK